MTGFIPQWLLSIAAFTTVFSVMLGLGLCMPPGGMSWVGRRPGLMAKALFCVLVVVPVLAIMSCRVLGVARPAEVGIVLMSIAPGAPIALRRSLGAGGHAAFAPSLQITLALLAMLTMPLWVGALDEVYAGSASIAPRELAKQVFLAQLLPFSLGLTFRRLAPHRATWLEPRILRLGALLLVVLVLLLLADAWHVTAQAGWRVALAIALTTAGALGVGHILGGPDPATRTAVAITSAARNAGLALLVATLNNARPEVGATILAYVIVSALTVTPYVMWRRRAAA